jgi:SAM-dependent methyltransferase
MTIGLPQRHARVLATPQALAYLAAPTFPLPDSTALHRVGSATPRDFLQTGLLLRAALEEAAGIEPGHAILDVGCGWGRLAGPLAARLGPAGRYLGMDAAAEAIAWCRRHIAEADPRFRFHHADIRNGYANPRGRIPADRAVLLPWEERFDRVVAFSLFTHLLPGAMARYLAEAARLCRPGGVLVASFFLLDGPAREALAEGRADRRFPAAHGIARVADPALPEDAVAYDAAQVMALLDAAGFEPGWRPGGWCPRAAEPFDYQDLVVARRRGAAPAAAEGLRGAVTGVSGGALRGWARGRGAPPALRLEAAGQLLAEGRAAEGGAFALPVPPHLLGRPVQGLQVLAGAEALPLLTRPVAILADPAEELAQGWRTEALRRGLWRIEALDWRDGALAGEIWALPPRALPPDGPPRLRCGPMLARLEPAGEADDAAGAAFGLPPGACRPRYRFRLPGRLPDGGAALRVEGADGEAWEPVAGRAVPGAPPPGPLAVALDGLALAQALRVATGLSLTGRAPCLVLPAEPLAALEAAPAGAARLVLAPEGLDPPRIEQEPALVAALARAVAPGGLVLAGLAGAAALLWTTDGTGRLLRWRRQGLDLWPEAPAGRRAVRSPAHLRAAWGAAFAPLLVAEAALSGWRDAVVLRRRPSGRG